MAVTNYYTVNGEILGESTSGTYLDYLTDALGSVTATVNQSAAIVQKARYKPYGTLLSGTQFKMGWVGTLGYRSSTTKFAESYVQHRTYGNKQGQWTSIDPIWPDESPYAYVSGNPTTAVDPNGLSACQALPCPPWEVEQCIDDCAINGRTYYKCTEIVVGKSVDILCECNCPKPVTSREKAGSDGNATLQKQYGPCTVKKKGKIEAATSCPLLESGTHQTTTYSCRGKEVTLSIVCCVCLIGDGSKSATTCFYKVTQKSNR